MPARLRGAAARPPNGPAAVPPCAPRPRPTPAGQSCPIPQQRGGHGPQRDEGIRGRLHVARPAGPTRAPPRRPARPPFLRGTAARPALPASPHIIGVPARELADILVHVLEAFLGFLQLLLQRAHRHRHPARRAAWPGLARGSAGKQGEQAPPTPAAAGPHGTANRAPGAPSDRQSPGATGRGTPPRWLARSGPQSQSPGADWHPERPTGGRLYSTTTKGTARVT